MANMIDLTISSNIQDFQSIRRFPADIKISELKNKLELLTGVFSQNMQLELRNNEDQFVSTLSDDLTTLEDNRAKEGYHLRVQDISITSLSGTSNGGTSTNGDGDGLDQVPKFELSEEAYAQRADSVRAWKQKEKLGRFDPEAQGKMQHSEAVKLEMAEKAAKSLKVGQRCEVRLPNVPPRRGTIAFVGATKFKAGCWAGIQYDEPVGKNDGSVEGVRYFQCANKYGGFVRPQDVVAGDFPEIGLDDMDEI